MQKVSRKNDRAVKIMTKTQILLQKTTEGNRRLGLGFAPTDL